MDMYPINDNLTSEAINKIFLEKSSPYSTNAITFYTDDSKMNNDDPTGASVY